LYLRIGTELNPVPGGREEFFRWSFQFPAKQRQKGSIPHIHARREWQWHVEETREVLKEKEDQEVRELQKSARGAIGENRRQKKLLSFNRYLKRT